MLIFLELKNVTVNSKTNDLLCTSLLFKTIFFKIQAMYIGNNVHITITNKKW